MIKNKLLRILANYTDCSDIDCDASLYLAPTHLTAGDMVYFFIDIEKEFQLDLDKLFDHITLHSVNNIACGIAGLTG